MLTGDEKEGEALPYTMSVTFPVNSHFWLYFIIQKLYAKMYTKSSIYKRNKLLSLKINEEKSKAVLTCVVAVAAAIVDVGVHVTSPQEHILCILSS